MNVESDECQGVFRRSSKGWLETWLRIKSWTADFGVSGAAIRLLCRHDARADQLIIGFFTSDGTKKYLLHAVTHIKSNDQVTRSGHTIKSKKRDSIRLHASSSSPMLNEDSIANHTGQGPL